MSGMILVFGLVTAAFCVGLLATWPVAWRRGYFAQLADHRDELSMELEALREARDVFAQGANLPIEHLEFSDDGGRHDSVQLWVETVGQNRLVPLDRAIVNRMGGER